VILQKLPLRMPENYSGFKDSSESKLTSGK